MRIGQKVKITVIDPSQIISPFDGQDVQDDSAYVGKIGTVVEEYDAGLFGVKFDDGIIGQFLEEETVVALHFPKGNSPTCPSCGNWNAMLDEYRHSENPYRILKCRDCGVELPEGTYHIIEEK